MPSSTDPAFSLTIDERVVHPLHADDHDVGGRGLHPDRAAYQGWTYWVFRRRISPADIPAHTGLRPNATMDEAVQNR